MRNFKTLVLCSVIAGLAAPVLASDFEDLYMSYKKHGDEAPQWLVDELFPVPENSGAGRTGGGESYGDAEVIPFAPGGLFVDSGTTVGMSDDFDMPVDPPAECVFGTYYSSSFGTGGDAFYEFTIPGPGMWEVSADICGASHDSALAIALADGSLVAYSDDYFAVCGSGADAAIDGCCLGEGTYYLVVGGYSSAEGDFDLTVSFGAEDCSPVPCTGPDVTVNMYDSYGDGWNGAVMTIGDTDVTLSSGAFGTTEVCIPSCEDVTVFVTGGSYPGEVSWDIMYDGDILLSGGAEEGGTLNVCDGTVDATELATSFELAQNHPNPFNPTTTIEFSLSQADMVSLTVFDLAGRSVATLVDGMMETGSHSVTFDAGELSSGVYFYTLQANGNTTTKKMVLMK